MPLLTAIKSFVYSGHRVSPGESFVAKEKEAALLVHVKYANYDTKPMVVEKPKEEIVEEISLRTGKPKRKYKRRDLKADK